MRGDGIGEARREPRERLYAEIRVGEACEFARTITEADVDEYARLLGDHNPLHVDAQYGRETQFGGRVAHGMLVASQFSTLIGMYLPGKYALYVSQELKFVRPVMLGETVTVRGEVVEKTDSLRLLTLKTEIFNQASELAVTGTAKVMVLDPFQEVLSEGKPMELNLSGKVAVISGASRGIGAATAILLGRHGAKVVVNYHQDEVNARAVVGKIESFGGVARAVQADVGREEDVVRMVEATVRDLGPVDVLVNNASPEIHPQPFSKATWEDYQRHLDVSLKGAFHCVRGVVDGMVSRRWGKIVNVVTTYTMGTPPPNLGAYVTAKSALLGFTKALAVELGPQGIQVNAVSPGLTDTALAAHLPRRFKDVVAAQAPLRRIASPEDVARVILLLVSEAGDFVTGVTVPVCGGLVMG